MPTLEELKAKWFVKLDGNQPNLVPDRRHTELTAPDALEVSTDGNTVVPLIDGQAYMKRWHDDLLALHGRPGARLLHAGWRLENVMTEGRSVSTHGALEDVLGAELAGSVEDFVLICRNVVTYYYNRPTVDYLRIAGVYRACLDNRFPAGGSNHQKFALARSSTSATAVLGSIDIANTRWDTPAHLPKADDRDRHLSLGKQTHDTGVVVAGPALADIERTYRERWNDASRTFGMTPYLPPQPMITGPLATGPATGTHSVQVLRTYGITSKLFGYSWSPRGEFSVWASYLNAVKQATTSIYIEDQYFLPFDWPPCHTRTGTVAQATDIVYQLGEAVKRGVRVIVVTPSNDEDASRLWQKYQRDIAVNYLTGIKLAGAPGDVVVAALRHPPTPTTPTHTPIYVHSKLLLVDDELLVIGSANVCQRSMTHDGEMSIAVVDSANTLVKEFRKAIWAEHTGRPPGTLDALVPACTTFKTDTFAGTGHLHLYPADPLATYPAPPGTSPPPGHGRAIRTAIDPYAGPAGIR